MNNFFTKLATAISNAMGHYLAFIIACLCIGAWAVSGPYFEYSDTWQLIINTGTTVLTFLMVFLIQNTQNRDARAMHLKLDELIHAVREARNEFIHAEELPDEELKSMSVKVTED